MFQPRCTLSRRPDSTNTCGRPAQYSLQVFNTRSGEDVGPLILTCSQHLQRGVHTAHNSRNVESDAIEVSPLSVAAVPAA